MTESTFRIVGTATAHVRPRPTGFSQWGALARRALLTKLRSGEFVLSVLSPILLTICFYIPLRKIMDTDPSMNYATFLMPVICLQSVGFVATSAAMSAATDGARGLTNRLRTMPVHPLAAPMARLTANAALLLVSLIWAVIAGLAIGWRPEAGIGRTAAFLLSAYVVGMVLAAAADVVGSITRNPAATSQALALPQLLLGMLSTGFVPEQRFPEWIRGFARNQPLSQFVGVMRGIDAGTFTPHDAIPSVLWLTGVAVAAAVAWIVSARREAH